MAFSYLNLGVFTNYLGKLRGEKAGMTENVCVSLFAQYLQENAFPMPELPL